MRIDFIFDTICPWCYIGKRRLDRALAMRPSLSPNIRWRPFLLNPDMPAAGQDRQVYLERKFGSTYRVQRIHAAATSAGADEGIEFNFDAITRTPSSVNSHRLIAWALNSDRESLVVENIFMAYFTLGLDISDIQILAKIAEASGLPGDEAERYLQTSGGISSIDAENTRVHRLGVAGVPCYIFDERYAVAGAQEADMLARLLDIAREGESIDASR